MASIEPVVTVTGVSFVQRQIALRSARVKAALNAVVREYTFIVERWAKRLAPVDTGRLRASIRTRLMYLVGEVFTDVEYAPYQEFGTSKMDAQPFLEPALESTKESFLRAASTAVRQSLR